MRYSFHYGTFQIEPVTNQPQIAWCSGLFVLPEMRGMRFGHTLKKEQTDALRRENYDYAMCSVDGQNTAQQNVLRKAGWYRLDEFTNRRALPGGTTQIWAWRQSGETHTHLKMRLRAEADKIVFDAFSRNSFTADDLSKMHGLCVTILDSLDSPQLGTEY